MYFAGQLSITELNRRLHGLSLGLVLRGHFRAVSNEQSLPNDGFNQHVYNDFRALLTLLNRLNHEQ